MNTSLRGSSAAPGSDARATPASWRDFAQHLVDLSLAGLPEMYRPDEELFVFCRRRHEDGVHPEGVSRRYTAITALGLAERTPEAAAPVLHGGSVHQLCARLLRDVDTVTNLGDVALTLWLAHRVGHAQASRAADQLHALRPLEDPQYVVELAWCAAALSMDPSPTAQCRVLRRAVAQRLMSSWNAAGHLFPHRIGSGAGVRGHVGCFADQVYPIQALSLYFAVEREVAALQIADRVAARICELIGPAGQWWWHYDARSGRVTEGYPVYSVHQNSMAPMALFAVQEAGGGDYRKYIEKGLAWLRCAPELEGRTLVDPDHRVIWRKVARREPNKLARQLQAAASALHPNFRVPVDPMLPPVSVDWECRPYHLGWILFTWTGPRLAALVGHGRGGGA